MINLTKRCQLYWQLGGISGLVVETETQFFLSVLFLHTCIIYPKPEIVFKLFTVQSFAGVFI